MTIKRAILPMFAAILLPGLAFAQAGTIATFETVKIFSDGDNPTEVTVVIDCNNAQILDADKDITEGEENGVDFVATDFQSDTDASCTITEEPVAGYVATYTYGISGEDATQSSDGCEFDNLIDGTLYRCVVTNDPASIDIVITKEWVLEGGIDNFNGVDTEYQIAVSCENADIVGGSECNFFNPYYYGKAESASGYYGDNTVCFSGQGPDSDEFTVTVTPTEFGNSGCGIYEETFDSAVVSDNGCGEFSIASTDDDVECTITNSVFFEGIPTMSQYGLALMALLMLGVGFVGFRRFV